MDLRFLSGKLHGSQNPAVQVGPDMVLESLLGFPLFVIKDVVVQKVILREPAPSAPLTGPREVLNGTQEFNDFRPMFRRREQPQD